MSFVRSSKYRHIFGTPQKDSYNSIKVTRNSADSTFCAVNSKFVAIVVQGAGGGPFIVLPLEKTGRLPTTPPTVNGHKDKVIELAWSPFNDNVIASCSEDCSIMLWEIPDEGLKETITEPLVTLAKHEKRVSLLQWHPTAENILASGGYDNKVLIWNCEEGECVFEIPHPDVPTCLSWSFNGSQLATTCKDKTLRVIDVRQEKIVQEKKNFFAGSKPSKCVFLKDGRIFTVGFSRMSTRLYALWDSKNLDEPLVLEEIDQASGAIYLHYDPDNNVVFLIGKGDANIKYYEVTNEEPYVFYLSTYSSTTSQRGFAWMPKRGLNVTTCEIARCYKLTEDKCEPVSLVVPRKSELFQEDIYPPCASDDPALTAADWLNGKDAVPKTMSLKEVFEQQKGSSKSVKKSNKPVRSLSQKTPKSNFSVAPSQSASQQNGTAVPPGVNMEELVDDVKKLKATVRKLCRRLNALEKQLGEVVADDVNEEEE